LLTQVSRVPWLLLQSSNLNLAGEFMLRGPCPINITFLARGTLANDLNATGAAMKAVIHSTDGRTPPTYNLMAQKNMV
jgi:hypothetical protein